MEADPRGEPSVRRRRVGPDVCLAMMPISCPTGEAPKGALNSPLKASPPRFKRGIRSKRIFFCGFFVPLAGTATAHVPTLNSTVSPFGRATLSSVFFLGFACGNGGPKGCGRGGARSYYAVVEPSRRGRRQRRRSSRR